jgi:hypothetical protein
MSDRLYAVYPPTGAPRLIRASNKAQAIAHVARTTIRARVADAETCFDLAKSGVVIEVAGELSEPAQ